MRGSEPRGIQVRIHLQDGRPEGLQSITVPTWNLDGHVCPRARFPTAKSLDFLRNPGVYLLEGETRPPSALSRLYVGEADVLEERISSHYRKLDFWQRVITFSASGEPLTQTHVKYLESKLIRRGWDAKRADMVNKVAPRLPQVSKADSEDAETLLDQILTVLPVVGVRAFELPTPARAQGAIGGNPFPPLFYSERGSWGEGRSTDEGFLLLKGARGRSGDLPRSPPWVRNMRDKLLRSKVLVREGDVVRLAQDYVFGSPSTAAAILVGGTVPGPIKWRTKEGRTLKRLEEEALRS